MNEQPKIIRVLVVEDSPVISRVIVALLSSDPQIQVAATARNGKEALELVVALKPDIVTMDIHMPIMDGYEATKQIMAHCPVPILIASAAVQADGIDRMYRAVSYGALDLIDISELALGGESAVGRKFIDSVKMLSRIKVVHHFLAKLEDRGAAAAAAMAAGAGPLEAAGSFRQAGAPKVLAIVASTGGPMAIAPSPSSNRFGKRNSPSVSVIRHPKNLWSGFREKKSRIAAWASTRIHSGKMCRKTTRSSRSTSPKCSSSHSTASFFLFLRILFPLKVNRPAHLKPTYNLYQRTDYS